MVYDRATQKITHIYFYELFHFLPKECAVFVNNTRVIKARLFGKKESGGAIEILLNTPLQNNLYTAYVRGRVKVGSQLFFEESLRATVIACQEDGMRTLAFFQGETPLCTTSLFEILERIGHVPLPPYIKREDSQKDTHDYQSVFAKHQGAVAAPTASLHFTHEMFETLKQKHETHFLTLHVGAGTFKPVEAKTINEHHMHAEYYTIPPQTLTCIESQKPLLAIGTTVTRTIEHYVRTRQKEGLCTLFLHPKHPPLRVNHLLTNFHLPQSTLIMLVASFVGLEKTLELYEEAVKEKYRFFSYGDAMLII